MTILGLQRKFAALDTDKLIDETIDESVDALADLNAEQINKGIKADGSFMPDYSEVSVEFYGKPDGPIRLRDTGSYQAGIYAKRQGDTIVFGSTDSKADKLTEEYGKGISGLSEKFKAEAIRETVGPVFRRKINLATGLKFG